MNNRLIIFLFLMISSMPARVLAQDTSLTVNPAGAAVTAHQMIRPKVAIISLADAIDFKKASLDLLDAAKNAEIDGIILEINSYGGAIDTFSTLHDMIKKITTVKPVIGLVVGSALSCGYMVASATDYIIAPSCAEIGNIGVIHIIQRYKNPKVINTDVEAKLDVEVFQTGEFKTISNNYAKELSASERKYVQNELNKIYKHIVTIISKNRNLNLEQYKQWADGKTFIAPEAKQLKLIDQIGTMFEAEEKICELIGQRNPNQLYAANIEPVFYEAHKTSVPTA